MDAETKLAELQAQLQAVTRRLHSYEIGEIEIPVEWGEIYCRAQEKTHHHAIVGNEAWLANKLCVAIEQIQRLSPKGYSFADLNEAEESIEAIQQQLQAKSEALREYGFHKNKCTIRTNRLCSCGLSEALGETNG